MTDTGPQAKAPLCLIPARGGSKRLARKNVALVGGRPIIDYSISAAVGSALFDSVYVSTEDAEIAEIARDAGAEVLSRPVELAGDDARVVDVAIHALDELARQGKPYEVLCVVYATAALLHPEDLQGGWDLFQTERANAVMGVTRFYEHPLEALRRQGPFLRLAFPRQFAQRQELSDYLVDAGYFYFIRAAVLRERRTFYVPRLAGYFIPRLRAVDINEPEDLELARILLEHGNRGAA